MSGFRLATLVKIVLVSVLVAVVLTKFDLREIAGYFNAKKLAAMLAVQPIIFLGFSLGAIRLAMLMGGRPLPIVASFKALMLCYGVNVVVPGRVSEVLKVTYMRDHAGIRLSAGFSAVFLERLADVLMLGSLALIAATRYLTELNTPVVLLALGGIVVLLLLPVAAPRLQAAMACIPSERFRVFVHQFVEHSVERMTRRAYLGVLGLSVLMWSSSLICVAVFFLMTGSIPIGISGALMVFIAAAVGGAVPALPGGIGTYEAAVVFVLRGYGYDLNEALALALALHGSQILLACVLAPFIALRERIGVSALVSDALDAMRRGK